MENIKFDTWVKNREEFSDDDKKGSIVIAYDILEIAIAVRRNGLLYIDDNLTQVTNDKSLQKALSDAISLTLNKTHVDDGIREKMQNEIIAGDYKGKELFKHILILEGVTAIFAGTNPIYIGYCLSSLFGENFFK